MKHENHVDITQNEELSQTRELNEEIEILLCIGGEWIYDIIKYH